MNGLGIILPNQSDMHDKRFGQFIIEAISDHIMYNNNPLDDAHIVAAIRYMDDQTLIDTLHQYHALLGTHHLVGFAYKKEKRHEEE